MKRPANTLAKRSSKKVIGARAFEAITAVEGLSLTRESRERVKRLQKDESLSPKQRRDEVLRAYVSMSGKK